MSEKKQKINIYSSYILYALSGLFIFFLSALFYLSYTQLQHTPNSMNSAFLLGIKGISEFPWLYLVIANIVISFVSIRISFYKSISQFTLITLIFAFGLTSIYLAATPCPPNAGLGCIGHGLIMLAYLGLLCIFSGTFPVLALASFRTTEKHSRLINLSGFIGIVIIIVLFFIPLKNSLQYSGANLRESNQILEEISTDPNFIKYEPTILPPGVSTLSSETIEKYEKGKLGSTTPTEDWILNNYDSLNYEKRYLYHDVATFIIVQKIINQPISKEDFRNRDIEALNNYEGEFAKSFPSTNDRIVLEELNINGKPALYSEEKYGNGQLVIILYFYPENRIRIQISGATAQYSVSKEDLIKTAEGLKKIK